MRSGFRKQVLIAVGFKQGQLEKIDVDNITDTDFQSMVKEKLLGAMANNGAKQKIVPAREVKDYVPQGWEYVASLPDGFGT